MFPDDPADTAREWDSCPSLGEVKLVRKQSTGHRTIVRAGAVEVGGDDFTVIAGPCAVESERQVMQAAEAVAAAGARLLRGGCFKPRTSPYAFQGLGIEGLKLLRKAGDTFGLPVVTEAMTDSQVPVVAEYTDVIQVGSRSMANAALLAAVSASRRPVLLKRGMVATVEDLLEAAEMLLSGGNSQVILCERGIRTFGTLTRNTADLVAVPLLRQITHLPVIVDPSHATGRRSLISPLCRAAAAIGADGLIIEVHPDPDAAWSDAEQSLSPRQFAALMRLLRPQLDLCREIRAMERVPALA
jgi:3-deoxy-7-phosphoheptulonate synthase